MATRAGSAEPDPVRGVERGVDRDERQGPVEQEDLDQGPGARGVAPPAARPPPERLVDRREHALLARLGERQRGRHGPRLADEDLEVVVEKEGLAAPDGAPLVAGDDRSRVGDLDGGAPDAGRQHPPGEPCRDRVEALADAHPRLRVDLDRGHPREVEGLGRQRPERRPVGLAILADRRAARPDVAREVRPVGRLELPVELGEAPHLGHRDEEAPPLTTDLALDAALLVGTPLARDAEERVEAVMAAQGDEPLGLVPVASPQHPGDQGSRVVVPDARRAPRRAWRRP